MLRVRRMVAQQRRVGVLPSTTHDWHPGVVGDEEIVGHLNSFGFTSMHWAKLENELPAVHIERAQEHVERRVAASQAAGLALPMETVRERFGLREREMAVLIAAAAPQLLYQFQRVYRYLQDDSAASAPTADLLLRLVTETPAERLAGQALFSPGATLLRATLLLQLADPNDASGNMLYRRFVVPPELILRCLGLDPLPAELSQAIRWHNAESAKLRTDQPDWGRLIGRLAQWRDDEPSETRAPFVMMLLGHDDLLKADAGFGILGGSDERVLVLDGERALPGVPGPARRNVVAAAAREAALGGGGLLVTGLDLLEWQPGELEGTLLAAAQCLALTGTPLFVGMRNPRIAPGDLPGQMETVTLRTSTHEEQERMWQETLAGFGGLSDAGLPAELASHFRMTGEEIRRAVLAALGHARPGGDGTVQLTLDELEEASRMEIGRRLGPLAEPVRSVFEWSDLILDKDLRLELDQVVAYVHNHRLVAEEWGLGKKLLRRRGVCALFYGPPGTGKTMAAGLMARELRLPAFRVELSRVVDKYIGETEKNLARLFDGAESGRCVLIFDEADALFSKRTAVRGSVDRYSNMEINYLLQRLESFDGIAVLTTNFHESIDEAFRRRLDFRLHFPFPDVKLRRQLWRSMLPAEMPIAGRVSYRYLAEEYELSGSSIRNAIVRAAMLAATHGRRVNQNLLEDGAVGEAQEMGRLVRAMD